MIKYIYRYVFVGLLREYKNILYYPDMERANVSGP